MSISKEEISKEKIYLENTINKIDEIIKDSNKVIIEKSKEIKRTKTYIWENKSEMDSAELRFNLDSVNMDVFFANQEAKTIRNLQRSKLSPYFSRIDFDDGEEVLNVYIGITGVKNSNEFYVYDWRTPIASLFYDYEPGECKYISPDGIVSGKLLLKRQYKIVNGKLKRCFDSNINIDDEYLQEVLATASSDKMKNIVDTIQLEQNRIIRNENDTVLVIQGVAGSGKTSVAMHRIAYLLYKEKLQQNNILIFSPNKVFSEYISNVLPELGEDNVLETTFSDFAKAYLSKFKVEEFSEFLDRLYNEKLTDDLMHNVKIKQSNKFEFILKNYMEDYHKNFHINKDIKLTEEIIVSKNEVNKMFLFNVQSFSVPEKIDYVVKQLKAKYKIRNTKKITQSIKSAIACSTNSVEIYNNLLLKLGLKQIESETRVINFEDVAPLLYVTFSLYGSPYSTNVEHVVIDEVQDYSLLQLELIKKVFKNAKYTILGDKNQTITPCFKYETLEQIKDIFKQSRYIELTKSYRSSEEIINYSNNILGLNNVCAVRRNNEHNVITRKISSIDCGDMLVNDLSYMKNNGLKRLAIITKTCEEANMIYDSIKNKIEHVGKVINSKQNKLQSITIIPAFIAKGLEFDGVIIYNECEFDKHDKNLYYVAATRAQHMLCVYNK